jgi:hypothetical protein
MSSQAVKGINAEANTTSLRLTLTTVVLGGRVTPGIAFGVLSPQALAARAVNKTRDRIRRIFAPLLRVC